MEIPKKNIGFPLWNPNRRFVLLLDDYIDKKEAFKKFRSSSSGFISNKTLRDVLLVKFNNKCVLCNSAEQLQIDHIESVLSCFNREKFNFCNTEDNLQVLCKKCNTSKTP